MLPLSEMFCGWRRRHLPRRLRPQTEHGRVLRLRAVQRRCRVRHPQQTFRAGIADTGTARNHRAMAGKVDRAHHAAAYRSK